MPTGNSDPTAAGIFVPVEGDYAITVLRRLFGSSIDTLLQTPGSGSSGTAVLETVMGTLNVAILFFATIVASVMMYQLVLDTARDGEAGGRDANLALTALRAALGAAMLLPVKGGLSVVQILVLQLLIFGSGLGDYVWHKSAEQMQQTATYTASVGNSGDSFITAQKLSSVLAARIAGHLCMLHANKVSQTLQTGDGAVSAQGPITVRRSMSEFSNEFLDVWYFGADQRYQSRNEVCGSTRLVYAAPPVILEKSTMDNVQLSFSQQLTAMANDTIRQNGRAAVAQLDQTAAQIAQEIYNGDRSTASIKSQILSAVSKSTSDFITGVSIAVQGSEGDKGINSLKASFLKTSTENGWMYAAIWQRALASYITKINGARNQLSFVNNAVVDPKAAVSSIYKSYVTGYSDTEKRLFENIDRDFSYLKNFDGVFQEAGLPDPASTSSIERVAANNNAQSRIAILQWLYSRLFSAVKTPDQSNQWNDPLVEIQEQGQNLIVAGGYTIAAGGITETVMGGVEMAGFATGQVGVTMAAAAGTYLGNIVSYLGYGILLLGVILAVLLPFLPFVYFLSGVIGWIIMSIEAMVAAPLWTLLTFAPHRSGDFIGTNKQGLLLLIAVFFRPVLLVIGLIACFIAMRVGIDLVNTLFSGVYMFYSADSSVTNLFLAMGLVGMYVLTLLVLVSNCCAITTGLGDTIMEFIGVNAGRLGQNSIGAQFDGTLNPSGRAAGLIESRASGAAGTIAKGLGRPLRGGQALVGEGVKNRISRLGSGNSGRPG